jgi:hypothetical protein
VLKTGNLKEIKALEINPEIKAKKIALFSLKH